MRFSFSEDLWLEWIADEREVNVEAVDGIVALYELAVRDYRCMSSSLAV